MFTETFTHFNILDIINIKRERSTIYTQNKLCSFISCRIQGESSFFYDNKEILVKKGDILFIPEDASYSQSCENEELICFHLDVYGYFPDKLYVYTPENPDEICSLFLHAANVWKERSANFGYSCLSDLYKLVSLSNFTVLDKYNTLPSSLIPAVEFLNAHIYDSDFSLYEMCKQSGISRTYFNMCFKHEFGCTPIRYINTMRIQKAKMLLKSGGYNREEIAALCGYSDVKYFYVVFKKITNTTIGKYLGK